MANFSFYSDCIAGDSGISGIISIFEADLLNGIRGIQMSKQSLFAGTGYIRDSSIDLFKAFIVYRCRVNFFFFRSAERLYSDSSSNAERLLRVVGTPLVDAGLWVDFAVVLKQRKLPQLVGTTGPALRCSQSRCVIYAGLSLNLVVFMRAFEYYNSRL